MDHSDKQLVLLLRVYSNSFSHQQMFLSLMLNIHKKIQKLLNLYITHPFNLIQVSFFLFISFIESINLKNQIVSQKKIMKEKNKKSVVDNSKPIVLLEMRISTGNDLIRLLNDEGRRKNIFNLVIEGDCGNELETDLKICGLEHLKKLIVKENSLKNLNSLIISNNDELEIIEIEDGQLYDNKNETYYAPFENVKIVEISSIFYLMFI